MASPSVPNNSRSTSRSTNGGITCTTERDIRGNIVDFVKHRERISPSAGWTRFEGLILLTNHGDIVNDICVPNTRIKRILVTVDNRDRHLLTGMATG